MSVRFGSKNWFKKYLQRRSSKQYQQKANFAQRDRDFIVTSYPLHTLQCACFASRVVIII